jgi:exonuclease-1
MKYVKMLLNLNINVIMVFDGRDLPAKANTEKKRRNDREAAKKRAVDLINSGRAKEAKKEFDKAVDITHAHAVQLMEACRKVNVDCITAMYEADAQLAYLNKIGVAEYIISEDSDLILFGCKKIVFKLTINGTCSIFDASKLHEVFNVTPDKFSFEKFRRICILSGCDYLDNLPGVGLMKAKSFMLKTAEDDMTKALPKIKSYLKLNVDITDDYIDAFMKAEATFKYMYIYDPLQRQMRRLNDFNSEDVDGEIELKYCVNAGELLDSNVAYQLALGNLDPKTMKSICNFDPTKPRQSSKPNVSSTPASIWKKETIQSFFKPRQTSQSSYVVNILLPNKHNQPVNIQKTMEEENDVEEGYEVDDLVNMYNNSPKCSSSRNIQKRDSSPEFQMTTLASQVAKNPFLKTEQHKEKTTEKVENLSLIKSISKEINVKAETETRVISRFFVKKEESKEVIQARIEKYKNEEKCQINMQLRKNLEFYRRMKTNFITSGKVTDASRIKTIVVNKNGLFKRVLENNEYVDDVDRITPGEQEEKNNVKNEEIGCAVENDDEDLQNVIPSSQDESLLAKSMNISQTYYQRKMAKKSQANIKRKRKLSSDSCEPAPKIDKVDTNEIDIRSNNTLEQHIINENLNDVEMNVAIDLTDNDDDDNSSNSQLLISSQPQQHGSQKFFSTTCPSQNAKSKAPSKTTRKTAPKTSALSRMQLVRKKSSTTFAESEQSSSQQLKLQRFGFTKKPTVMNCNGE